MTFLSFERAFCANYIVEGSLILEDKRSSRALLKDANLALKQIKLGKEESVVKLAKEFNCSRGSRYIKIVDDLNVEEYAKFDGVEFVPKFRGLISYQLTSCKAHR